MKFKCNGCLRETEFIYLDKYPSAEGFRVYMCKDCCCVGVKNTAEELPMAENVQRCIKCGSWQYIGKDCHTCLLVRSK